MLNLQMEQLFVRCGKFLLSLDLRHFEIPKSICPLFSMLPKLRHLYLHKQNVNDADLGNTMQSLPNLISITFDSCFFSDDAEALAKFLRNAKKLIYLNFNCVQ